MCLLFTEIDTSMNLKTVCRRALLHNLGLRQNEKILIIGDGTKSRLCKAFEHAAEDLGAVVHSDTIPVANRNGQEPPEETAAYMLLADVVIMLVSGSLSWTKARMEACERGARIASMGGGFNEEIALRAFTIDYEPIRERANKFCDLLDAVKEIRIVTALGSDLTLQAWGRLGHGRKGGIYRQPGYWGNLPCGEAFLAPLEGESQGVYVVDASHAGIGRLSRPIRIVVRDGRAVSIEGGLEARRLRAMLDAVNDDRAFNIAEFGIGCNDQAVLSGATIEDEKVLGTCHIAMGSNSFFGGKTAVGIHVDGIILKPSIFFDGRPVMQEGTHLI